ncbi:MAG: DNA-invertase hin [Planctomycetota bacterium]|jgi:site-specific DNA recombinase
MSRKRETKPAAPVIRCAIYTRKSTEEGLEQEFNSLDAQRDAGEAYIRSQQHEGWICLPDHYDDGGFTGANMERPALRRLLADIDAGKVDCVVVYKVDRLSRSLLDFSKIMEAFDHAKVSFVSVTQAFNTASSMGRLILNVLLSFAQFEREMISERTRDKIAAARRKGKWAGGMPILGYTVVDTKLVVDEAEAQRVREIFRLYLDRRSVLDVAKELNGRGWRTKSWTTRKSTARGGRPFNKKSLYDLLTNVAYIGKIRHKDDVHDGEQTPIVDERVFAETQTLLKRNGRSGGRATRTKHAALLRGMLRCATCNCAMSHSFTARGPRQYRYYVCQRAQTHGWDACPAPSIPAGEIERFVIDEIKCVGRDPQVIRETLVQAQREAEEQIDRLKSERAVLVRRLRDFHAEIGRLAAECTPGDRRLTDAQDRIRDAEQRVTQIDDELAKLATDLVDESDVVTALADFDALWVSLSPREQARVVELLVDQVAYDGQAGRVAITFRPSGIKTLAAELAASKEEAA